MPRYAPEAVCPSTHRHDPDRPRRAADGLNLCHGCLEGMRRQLAELPWLHAEVVASMPTAKVAGGQPVSGSRERSLPVNLNAGELRSQIEYDLYTISVRVAADRGLHLPSDGRVVTVCAWLGRHVDWLAAQTDAGEVRGVIVELTGLAYGVIDPKRAPVDLGRCVETTDQELCDGTLRASILDVDDKGSSRIWCDTCTLDLTAEQWYRFGKRYHTRLAEITREQAKQERMAS